MKSSAAARALRLEERRPSGGAFARCFGAIETGARHRGDVLIEAVAAAEHVKGVADLGGAWSGAALSFEEG